MGFATACSKYFGRLPGQTTGEFAEELRALTPEDREEMAPLLSEELGQPIDV